MQLILTENGVVRVSNPVPTPIERQQINRRVVEKFSNRRVVTTFTETMEIRKAKICGNCFQRPVFAGSELCRICLNAKNQIEARADLIRATKLWLSVAAASGFAIVLLVYFFGVRPPRTIPAVKELPRSVAAQAPPKTVPF